MSGVAIVNVAATEEAARLAELPLEATVALGEVAGAIKDGLLAFASATGLVVIRQIMEAELSERSSSIGALGLTVNKQLTHVRMRVIRRTRSQDQSARGQIHRSRQHLRVR
jgi:hypothetical protein